MGIPSYCCCRGPGSNITFSHCFEEMCTRSTTQKSYGTFFSVVHRKIDDLNIIMAGEIDCSTSIRMRLTNRLTMPC